MTSNFKVDLINCDKEPIHIPGFIQAHGFLLAVHPVNRTIEKASENTAFYTGVNPAAILGKKIQDVFTETTALLLNDLLNIGIRKNNFEGQNPAKLSINNKNFDLVLHQHQDNIIIEFEERLQQEEVITLQKVMTTALAKIQSADSAQKLLDNVAGMIKEITGYDRVMIYKFHRDQHGEVMAEAKNNNLESFLHLHYPATDIPLQARELYKINLVRIIGDVNSTPSALLGIDAEDIKPLDLTHSVLRAVSPIHIEYLKNMGVNASFSISLLYKKELWGLIACHNYQTKMIDYNSRIACCFIGQLFSAALEFRTEEDLKQETEAYSLAAHKLHEQMEEELNIVEALTGRKTNLLNVNTATGAALFFENKMYLLGKTPREDQVKNIALFLKNELVPVVYDTSGIAMQFEPARETAACASGVLVAELSQGLNEYIMWFKPEIITTVDWAGNPQKALVKAEDGTERLLPRKSFEKWTAEIKYKSEEWTRAEIGTAVKLREDTIQLLNKKATEIRKLNDLLNIAYEELDTFTYTISHDLKTPLSTIKNYAEIILEDYAEQLPAETPELLQKIIKGTDKMAQLIKDVLHYSKVGRAGIEYKKLNMTALLNEVAEENRAAAGNPRLKINIRNCIDVYGDETMIIQLFQNLLGNAIKYSVKKPEPVIDVSAEPYATGLVLYSVSDNGIGLDMKYAGRIFELFRRLDNVQGYDGTGVGLAIVKRIVEKHSGKIWVESELNNGTKFYLTLLENLS